MKPYREITDGKLHVNFHPGQYRVLQSAARFISMQAGTQGGKTCFEPDWLLREIELKGEGDYLVGTATYPLLDLKLLPEFLYLFKTLLNKGEYKETKKIFQFYGSKTRIIFFSATNPESIESATAKAAVLDEAGQNQFKRGTYEAVMRRLSLSEGRILFGTTLYNLGWFKTEVYDRWKAGDPDYEVVAFPSTLNPAFPRQEFERARKTMPGWKFSMYYMGEFARPAGLIFDCFQPSHILTRTNIPTNWPVYVGHDFGGQNPAAVFLALNPATGEFTCFQSYKPKEHRAIIEQINEFKRITEGYEVRKRVGGSHQEEGWREAYRTQGWPVLEPSLFVTHPKNAVETGIERVYARIKLNKLFIFHDLYDLLDEIQTYSRKLDDNYGPTDDIDNKSSYHLLDSLRYIVGDSLPETASAYKVKVKSFM